LTDEQRQQIHAQLLAARGRANSPEGMGWAIVNYALTNATIEGNLNGNQFELPMVVSISLPPPPPAASSTADTHSFSEVETCHEVCVIVLGHQVYCWSQCHTEIVST
jgi:hypothetical protein